MSWTTCSSSGKPSRRAELRAGFPGVCIAWLCLAVISGLSAMADAGMQPPRSQAAIPEIAARALPGVVSITTRRIDRDQFNKMVPKAGVGSGVIVDRRGHILTNSHVVQGFEDLKVTLPDGRTFLATLVGADRFTDLAVLRIEGRHLTALPLGNSAHLRIGETVVGIGYPLWIEGGPTVTVGVISGMGRSMEEADDPDEPVLHDLLQTDAAINPGNSGGPLLNLKGEVIGINTAIMPSAHGIGFAIPINNTKPVMKAIMAGVRAGRPSLGVAAVSVTPQLAFANNFPVEHGTLVVRVERGGPAEVAGLQVDDIITTFAGQRVRDLHHLHALLARRAPGESVVVTILRDGETLVMSAVLTEER